jgi:DNA gyrase subunit A
MGRRGILQAYATGRGLVRVRAKYHIEEGKTRSSIVFTEIPFQVRKETIIDKIVEVVNEERITGISNVQDFSDRDGIRLAIELKKGEDPQVVVNQLFQYTPLQSTQSINNLVIDRGPPRTLTLRGLLDAYIPTAPRGADALDTCATCARPTPVLGRPGKGRPLDTFAPGHLCHGHAVRA